MVVHELHRGDVVYVPYYGIGIVMDWYQLHSDYFKVVFHDEIHTYHRHGDLCLESLSDHPYDKLTSVKRIDFLGDRLLKQGDIVYNFIKGIGKVVGIVNVAEPPNAVIYYYSDGSRCTVPLNGKVDSLNHSVDISESVYPMNKFIDFTYDDNSVKIAECKQTLDELTQKYYEMRNKLKSLGCDVSDYMV